MYKADLKYSNFHSNYLMDMKKKSLSMWSDFFVSFLFFFLQTSKMSINRHIYLCYNAC